MKVYRAGHWFDTDDIVLKLLDFVQAHMTHIAAPFTSGEMSFNEALDIIEHDLAIWCQDEDAHLLAKVEDAFDLLRLFGRQRDATPTA